MNEFEERMRALRARFVERMGQEAEAIAALSAEPAARAELADRVHKLAGLSGSMGFPEVSERAKAFERALAEGDASLVSAAPLLDALRIAVESARR